METNIKMLAKEHSGYFKDSDGEECYQFNDVELTEFTREVEAGVLERAKQKLTSVMVIVTAEGDSDYNGGIVDSIHVIDKMANEIREQ